VPRIVITLPAYRAERTLAQTVADIPPGVADRLILVDDASPDNTAELARRLGIEVHVHRENLGYGGNQKTCYTEALTSGADVVVLLHPDYQYEPKAVPLLIAPILAGDADMTFGSRFAGLGDPIGGGMPIYRYVGNRLTTMAENLMLGSRFTELHSGLRAYTRRCLLSLPFLRYSNDFLFDSQLLIDAVTSGRRVVEVPIPTRYTMESSSIAIDRSLAYIGGTLAYCARLAAERGRRGRRSPVVAPTRQHSGGVGTDACPACAGKLEAHDRLLQCTSCGLVASISGEEHAPRVTDEIAATTAAAILDVVGGYFAPGARLLALGTGKDVIHRLAQKRGWEPAPANDRDDAALPSRPALRWASEHERISCIVTYLDGKGSPADAMDEVERAKSLLDREGLLVMAAGPDVVSRTPPVAAAQTFVLTPQSIQALLKRTAFEMVEWIPAQPAAPFGRLRSRRDSHGANMAVARLAKTVVPSPS
jgi:hypothetical protein